MENERHEPDPRLNDLSHDVIGAAIEVHRILGPGYLEGIYEEALAVELALRGIRFERQKPVSLEYKGQKIGDHRLDLLVDGVLVVELKAVDALAPIHKAQVLSYLKSTGKELALLMNFNVRNLSAGIERLVLTR